jgi:uncharacterized protein
MWFALAISSLTVAYNNLINRWGPFHGAAYVPVNLTFAGAVTFATAVELDLSRTDLGLLDGVIPALAAVAAVALFGIGALAIARSRHAHRIADRRVAGLRGGALAYHVLVRIPLGTAVTEEVLFRGVLFAAWRDAGLGNFGAALYASLAFGLWHVSPTIIGVRMNDPGASRSTLWAAVVGAVLLTTIVGMGLTWLRLQSGGLLVPIVLHGGVNSMGALAAVMAGRRTERGLSRA